MSLEDRLRRARDDYRQLGAAAILPEDPSAGSAGAAQRRRRGVSAAAAVVVLVVAGLVVLVGDDDGSESVDVISPDPTMTEKTVVVPEVVSRTVADARATLDAVGLELAVHDRDGDLADATVIAQEPPAGTEVATGGIGGETVVGVRTSVPAPPETADCPAMAVNRTIPWDASGAMPRSAAVDLAPVREKVDAFSVELAAGDDGTVLGYRAAGVYVGDGVVASSSQGPDGEPVVGPVGHHIVVEVASPEDCPEVPTFADGTVVWFTLGWPSAAASESTQDQPAGAIALYDPDLVVEPAGPYLDGQEATLIRPEDYTDDWLNAGPRLCAIVGDDSGGPPETCDPLGQMSTDPISPTEVELVLAQRIFTPTGYRDCAEDTVTCRLVLRDSEGTDRATARLSFRGNPEPQDATLSITATDDRHEFAIDPEGLTPHSSWIDLRDVDPSRVEGFPAFVVSVCAFGSTEPDTSPYGDYLWGQGVFDRPLAPANCDTTPKAAELNPDDPNEPISIPIPGRIHGYSGWSDCRVDRCFIQIRQSVVDEVDAISLTGHDLGTVAALVPFDPTTALPAPPSIRIVETGPLRAGQTITVEIAGLPEGTDTNISVCTIDAPWGCGYIGTSFGVTNGVHRLELPVSVSACAPEQCYLELDSRGEGVPPLATTPLPTGN